MTARNRRYEILMAKVGDFGTFQKRLCLLLVLSTVPNGYFAMLMVFVARTPPYRCYVPGWDGAGATAETATFGFPNGTATMPNFTLLSANGSNGALQANANWSTDSCPLPVGISADYGGKNLSSTNDESCPYGFVYGFEEGRTSIITEWNLICNRSWISPLITSIYMSGVLIGSVASGSLSDRFGRYPTFLLGTIMMFVFLGLCGLSVSPAMFTVFLFFAGAFGYINYVTAFVIAAEMINAKDRVVTGTLTVGGFAVGYMLLPLFAYFIPNWRILCFVLASLGVVFIPYIWLMSESPRWLFSKGKKEPFIKLLRKIAKVNGISQDQTECLIQEFLDIENEVADDLLKPDEESEPLTTEETTECGDVRSQYSYFDLVRRSVVRSRTLNVWITWFVCSVVYFGVGFNTSNMGGNPYINCFVAAAVEIPAYAMVIALLKWQGRKPILITTLIVAGLTCSAVPYLKNIDNNIAIGFAMVGKFAVSGSFSIIYIFCSELFPTLMRSMAIGSASMAARVGGMVAPYMLHLGKSYEGMPYIVMGVLSMVACLCNAVLPETRDTPLPETIDDLKPIKYFTWLTKRRRSVEKEGHC